VKSYVRPLLAFLILCSGLALPAVAHDKNMTQKVRDLGIAVGNSFTCIKADQKESQLVFSEALFDAILFDLGHAQAYVYAVAVGHGAGMKDHGVDCSALDAELASFKAKIGMGTTQ